MYSSDGIVTNYWGTDKTYNHYSFKQGLWDHYNIWTKAWVLQGRYGTIAFSAQGHNDVTVGVTTVDPWTVTSEGTFYSTLTSSSAMYEFVIGGGGNSWSGIRKGTQTDPVSFTSTGIPSSTRLIDYQVVFYKNKRTQKDVISVYFYDPMGNTQGKWTKLMSYEDPICIPAEKRWFSFTAWNVPVRYTNIVATQSTVLPPTH